LALDYTGLPLRAVRRPEQGGGARAGAIGSLVARLCLRAEVSELIVTDIKDYNLNFISSLGPCKPVNAGVTDTFNCFQSAALGYPPNVQVGHFKAYPNQQTSGYTPYLRATVLT
jgi:threonine dehydrogenase-like Zn-dependent dehydrogenase